MNKTIIFVDSKGQALTMADLVDHGKPILFGKAAKMFDEIFSLPGKAAEHVTCELPATMVPPPVTQGVTQTTRQYLRQVLFTRKLEISGELERWQRMKVGAGDYSDLIRSCQRELQQIERALGELP